MVDIIWGDVAVDDRGSVRFVNDFDFKDVKRFYQVSNHERGFIRAWHGHIREGKYVYVAKGSIILGVSPIDKDAGSLVKDRTKKLFLSATKPRIVYIPPGNANGFKTLEEDTIVMFYSTSTLEESMNDDIRYDWNVVNIWDEDYR